MAEKKTAQNAIVLISGASGIEKAIASIKNRGAKLDGDIQLAGLSVLAHIDKYHDTTLADRLFNAMPKGSRRLALAEWLLAFGRMRALAGKADAEAIKAGRVFQYEHGKSTDMQGATDTPWHEFRKEKAVSEAFDAQAAVKALLARLGNAQKKGLAIEHAADALAEARALVAALEQAAVPQEGSIE